MQNYFEKNRERWNRLPAGRKRVNIEWLLKYPDWLLKFRYNQLVKFWEKSRSWEYEKYSRLFAGRNVLEVGGGLGYDGIVYSKTAQSYTYAELNEIQIQFLQRIVRLFGAQNMKFELMTGIHHRFPDKYNAFLAHGVFHHVPFETARGEFQNINGYLESGAVVVMLMYPKERWEEYKSPPFEKFGKYTDGGCPWTEWYDEEKVMKLVGCDYVLLEAKRWFVKKSSDFINFELRKK